MKVIRQEVGGWPTVEHEVDLEGSKHVTIELEDGERFVLAETAEGRLEIRHHTCWHGHINVEPKVGNVLTVGCSHAEYPDMTVKHCEIRFAAQRTQ